MLETPPTLSDLIRKLAIVDTSDECLLVAADLAALVHKNGLSVLPDVLAPLLAYCANKKSGLEREGGFLAIAGLVQALGKPCEPYMLPLLPVLMDGYQDKGLPVRQAAELAATNIVALCDPLGVELVLPSLYQATTRKWQVKIAACKHLENLAILSPQQVGYKLPELIPVVSEVMHEIRAEVSQAAIAAMMEICKIVGNPDIEQHIPLLVDCMAHPDHVSTAVQTLSSTTFVAEVTGPALGIMVPLLVRALNDRSAAVLRSSVVIANNLFKLVRNPEDAGQFMSQLLPGLERIIDTAAYPEVRTLASEAKATLVKAAGGEAGHEYIKKVIVPVESIQKLFKAALVKKKVLLSAAYDPTFYHVSFLVSELLKAEIYERSEWTRVLAPYLETIISNSNAESLLDSVHLFYNDIYNEKQKLLSGDDDADGELLCNCQFSLAYGGMMLLNHTRLRLRRGQRYGLCAHNGAGKSTLLRAISLGKVEGFPGEDEVKTVFVEHKLQGVDASLSVLDFLAHDPKLADLDRSEIASALEDVGFGDDKQSQPVGALSGGWKMKLELARAILIKADILLLDEPTNHLDVANIAWLENYLNTQTEITSIIVSHDSAFLDNVCTYIIHYESKKLVYYKGNLSKFVEKKPEAKSYYTLAATTVKFSFPPPSILLGIRSNTKAILKMVDGTFTYPGAPKPSMKHVSVQLSLSSRVGIVGPNGAGIFLST